MRLDELPTNGDWSADDWETIFDPAVNLHFNGGTPEWYAATPPPKTKTEPVAPADVAEVTAFQAESPEGYGSVDMAAVARLHDGRWAVVESWADTTGWGCQAGATWHVGGSLQDVARWGLSEEARRNLGLAEMVAGS